MRPLEQRLHYGIIPDRPEPPWHGQSTDIWSNGGRVASSAEPAMPRGLFRAGGAIVRVRLLVLTPTVSTLVSSSNLADHSDGFTAAGNYLYAVTDSGTAIRRYDATTGQ